eukprot:TRINITY_DN4633_c0_g1_i1.p1 TRINITY_DN4633_c0_g1~~TRINITY_DN4633_c0_g1_i1.p1  ORF type:complete len:359 (+),score=134.42 TRINITY_DN4633_c0_g1_i1:28-1077(+)
MGHMVQMNRDLNDAVAASAQEARSEPQLVSLLKTFDQAKRAVQEAEGEAMFKFLCRRGGSAGWLSAEQVRQLFEAHPKLLEDVAAVREKGRAWERVALIMDGDANGAVSKAEFHDFYEGHIPPADIDALFRKVDRNSDRVVSALELTNACNRSQALQHCVGGAYDAQLREEWEGLYKDAHYTKAHSAALISKAAFVKLWAGSGLAYAKETPGVEKLPPSLCAANEGYEAHLDNQRDALTRNDASYAQYQQLLGRIEGVHHSHVAHLSALFSRLDDAKDGGPGGAADAAPVGKQSPHAALEAEEAAARGALAGAQHTHWKFLMMSAREARRRVPSLAAARGSVASRRSGP